MAPSIAEISSIKIPVWSGSLDFLTISNWLEVNYPIIEYAVKLSRKEPSVKYIIRSKVRHILME